MSAEVMWRQWSATLCRAGIAKMWRASVVVRATYNYVPKAMGGAGCEAGAFFAAERRACTSAADRPTTRVLRHIRSAQFAAEHPAPPVALARRYSSERKLPQGVYLRSTTGALFSSIRVDGQTVYLGQFKDVDTASVAWQAADAARQAGGSAEEVKLAAKSAGSGEIQVEGVEGAAGTATSVPPVDVSSEDYIGVASAGDGQWEAVFTTAKGLQVSGGSYDSPEEAARAYDALARMYEGSGATTNFVVDTYSGWVPPDEVDEAAAIPVRPREPLSLAEVVSALEAERGVDVSTLDLAGKSDLAEHMVFVTGRSVAHMRKMGDLLVNALRARQIPGLEPELEGRDEDYWMVVDGGNIIVNIFDEESREVFDLENFWSSMSLDDSDEEMSFEEWLEANPVPEKWIARLERDEMEER